MSVNAVVRLAIRYISWVKGNVIFSNQQFFCVCRLAILHFPSPDPECHMNVRKYYAFSQIPHGVVNR